MKKHFLIQKVFGLLLLIAFFSNTYAQGIQRLQLKGSGDKPTIITLEFWDDDLVHLRFGDEKTSGKMFINTTLMVGNTNYTGAKELKQIGNTIETQNLRIVYNPYRNTLNFFDKQQNNISLVSLTPYDIDGVWRGIKAYKKNHTHFFGLGQRFDYSAKGVAKFDWNGKKWEGGKYGNEMIYENGGATGATQIPILYALHAAKYENYAIFFDNEYKQRWSFEAAHEWTAEANGGELDFFFFQGQDLKDLRKDFMELTGKPPIPPKHALGLWVSEYGYDNWQEIDDKLTTLRQNKFPLEGFILDLQWFGNIQPNSFMGKLDWDTKNFPDAPQKLKEYANKGVHFINIEEPYVAKRLPEFDEMYRLGLLATYATDRKNAYLLPNAWWGAGGMFDYTNPRTSVYIHENKRKKLIEDGIVGHWCDLGEPENYNDSAAYYGGLHKDIHNLFALNWAKGLYENYQKSKIAQRPFILGRSGAAGIQRYGAALWSGDISARISSLEAQQAAQANMAFSGIDYYGSDIGGFHRYMDTTIKVDFNDTYTRWFAYGCLFEIPVRPHTVNIDTTRQLETAPDRIGDKASNLVNIRLRYSLTPYYYSLAYKAYKEGEPIFPPLIYHYQTDKQVNNLGDHKLIGESLLGVATTKEKETTKNVYLPTGTWINFYDHEIIKSKGKWLKNVPLFTNQQLRLPLYAKAGAIIPMQYIDDATWNLAGKRSDNRTINDLWVRIFADKQASNFVLYEDDGKTNEYITGNFRTINISQEGSNEQHTVNIAAAEGNYKADEQRSHTIELVIDKNAKGITVNGVALKAYSTRKELVEATSGFVQEDKVIVIKTKATTVKTATSINITW